MRLRLHPQFVRAVRDNGGWQAPKLTARCRRALKDIMTGPQALLYQLLPPREGAALREDEVVDNALNIRNGWVFSSDDPRFGLPDPEDLLSYQSREMGLNAHKLRDAGVTDFAIYARVLLHEVSHVRGQNGHNWDGEDSFVQNEAHVYAYETAEMLRNRGTLPEQAAKFVTDFNVLENIFWNLMGNRSDEYAWTPSAVSLTRARLRSQPDIWDNKNSRFRDDFYAAISRFAGPPGSACTRRPFAAARKALLRHHPLWTYPRNCHDRLLLRDAAVKAENDLTKKGHDRLVGGKRNDEPFRAALILRQLARAIDDVYQYAEGYYPPVKALASVHPLLSP